jgi:hypothetical protein
MNAILARVRQSFENGTLQRSPGGEVHIPVEGRTAFVITARSIRCTGCSAQLVPRSTGLMTEWSWGKARFVRDHLECAHP